MTIAQIKAAIASLTAPLTLSALKSMLDLMADEQRPYKVYTALLSQSGTDIPSAVVLENSLGTIAFVRGDVGVYSITSTGLFVTDKTFILFKNPPNQDAAEAVECWRIDADTLRLQTSDGGTPADAILVQTSIEIRVYE